MFDALRHHWQVWRQAWRNRDKSSSTDRPYSKESEFLPAALEIQDKPPAPLGRIILWTIMAVFLGAVIWATLGEVDVVTVAHGKIIPVGHVKYIQPRKTGRISKIEVHQGQHVHAGEHLIKLDPTISHANKTSTVAKLKQAKANYARLSLQATLARRHKLTLDALNQQHHKALNNLSPQQKQLLTSKLKTQRSKIESLKHNLKRDRHKYAATQARVSGYKKSVPLLQQRAKNAKALSNKQYIARSKFQKIKQKALEQSRKLAVNSRTLQSLKETVQSDRSKLESTRESFLSHTLSKKDKKHQKIIQLQKKLNQANERSSWETLSAPISGRVQELKVHTTGGVVKPGQKLMKIVPDTKNIEVKAWVHNQDIGYVQTNQDTKTKIKTFPFTKYGTIKGEVKSIGNDAVKKKKRGLVYPMHVTLNRKTIHVKHRDVQLEPGMAVTVEIKTGHRRIIRYFLAPLLRFGKDSLHER